MIALPLLALFAGVTAYNVLKSSRPRPPAHKTRETVQPVRTIEITVASHQPRLHLYGEIRSGRKVELRALVAGKVLKTGALFRDGARVRKGDLLLSIDPFSYRGAVIEAKAKIAEAKAKLKEIKAQIRAEQDSIKFARHQLRLSMRDFDRARKLVRHGSVTRQGAEQRELIVSQRQQAIDGKVANLDVLRARADQQRASLESLQWRLQQARRNLMDTDLKAPFDGYIADVNADAGRLLNVNDKVALLLDANRMEAVFTLSDQQYGRLLAGPNGLVGRTVEVTWHLGEQRLQYKARIARLAAQILPQSGGVRVYAKLLNPASPRPVRAGAFVEIEVPDRIYHQVARLPQTALYGGNRVYVVGEGNRLEERQVMVKATEDETVLVSGNLASGERVVVTRLSTIGAGMKVRDLRDLAKPRPEKSHPVSLTKAQKLQRAREWQSPAKTLPSPAKDADRGRKEQKDRG